MTEDSSLVSPKWLAYPTARIGRSAGRSWRDFAVLGAALVRGFSCVFEGSVLRLNTFRAHAMRGRRIKALFEKLFDAHPIALERNLVAPRANPRETLQVMHSAYDPARRAGDDEPNRKHE